MRRITPFFIICTLVFSCTSPQQSFKNNDYNRAYKSSLKKIKKGYNSEEYLLILKESLAQILVKEELKVFSLKESNNLNDKSKAISKLTKMRKKILDASQFTNNEFSEKDSLYKQEIQSLKVELGRKYFDRGLSDLDKYDKSKMKVNARSANRNFINAKKYEFDYVQLDSLISYSMEEAKLIYVIEPDLPICTFSFDIDNILEDLEKESNKFILVKYDPIAIINNADCVIEIEIKPLDIDLNEDISLQHYEKEVEQDSSIITVEAQVEIKKITKESELIVFINPSGNKNCTVFSSQLSKTFVETTEKYNCSGDERAIPMSCKNNLEAEFKDEDDVFLELLNDLYPEIQREIF